MTDKLQPSDSTLRSPDMDGTWHVLSANHCEEKRLEFMDHIVLKSEPTYDGKWESLLWDLKLATAVDIIISARATSSRAQTYRIQHAWPVGRRL